MEDVRRLHRPEQGMPKGLLPITSHRLVDRRDSRARAAKLLGCLLWLQSDPDGRRRPREDDFYYSPGDILLQGDALWAQKRGCNILEVGHQYVQRPARQDNGEKYAFGVASGKFLGFLVSQRGIEVNPDQIKATDTIPEILNSKKQVQKLTGCHKFFNLLRKDRGLQWNEECIKALRKLKEYLSSPPLLVKADPGECLLVYLTVSEVAVSAVLVRENKGMKLAIKYGARRLILHCDSQLVVNQVTGTYQIKEQRLQKYQSEIHKLMPEFDECRFEQIPRGQNVKADSLAKLAATTKNINKENVVTLLHSAVDHVEDGTLPRDKKEAKKLRVQAARYSLINHDLYKRTFGGPLAKCLGPHQTRQVLEEVHEGHCGAHTGNRAVVRCLIRAGYYWPTMKKEAADYVRKCKQCQKYAPMIHQAGELLHSVTSPWPFIKWGMDIIGPLPAGRGNNSPLYEQDLHYMSKRQSTFDDEYYLDDSRSNILMAKAIDIGSTPFEPRRILPRRQSK
ncbi:PREDICTED: uncharacterized protein LOC109209286 [Nicotiana attenuata]|uniref:uncharacterized protein LOC109209286 n=1 Tax=Nicotiana attenuata TaxID=49451 RepID=UPI00090545B5|nr:PREDICTED: uncharacterized protein LOC109209286 [Nicotiana attenuata]